MIYFRCDGNSLIGGGHVMRCLSIASAFKNKNVQCCFVLADSEFQTTIIEKGFQTIILNTDYSNLELELDSLYSIISKNGELLFIDSYYVTDHYLSCLKKITKVVYIDDLALFAYPVDFLINYNIYAKKETYLNKYKNSNIQLPKLLLGTKYVPLREEFLNTPIKIINNDVKDILVSTGASDPLHIALKMINDFCEHRTYYNFHFLIGNKNIDINSIEEKANALNNVFVYYQYNSVCELMQKCDIAISAAGSTLYELCKVGTPIISYASADNQLEGLAEFTKRKLVVSAGDIRDNSHIFKSMLTCIEHLRGKDVRVKMSREASKQVDGYGAFRIVEETLVSLAHNN